MYVRIDLMSDVTRVYSNSQVRILRGTGGPDPPGKSQVIWVSIGNKLLDPPPLEKIGRPLENVGPPLEP